MSDFARTKLVYATRKSRLATTQTEEAVAAIRRILPATTQLERVLIETIGDRDLKISLSDPSVPDDFFTRDLDDAMLAGKADIGVHSAKDLPKKMREGIVVAAYLPALDIRDALVVRADTLKGGHRTSASAPQPTSLGVPPLGGLENIRVVGTSSPKREVEIRRQYPNAELKALRGTIDSRLEQLDRGDYDAILVAACALERLGLANRISEYLPYDPAPQQGRLAITTRADDKALTKLIGKLDVRKHAGLVALVGCPADISLLSVKVRQYLKKADVILHDRLLPEELLAEIKDRAVLVGKTGGEESTPQSEIHRLMLHEAEKGKLVVRLHGGDPLIYSRLADELEFLTAWNIRVDVVPAPTAAQVAAAHARSPLTHRGSGHRLTLMSAVPAAGTTVPPFPAPEAGNLAVYMAVKKIAEVRAQLVAAGWPANAPVIACERIGHPDEQIVRTTLDAVEEIDPRSPTVFLLGTRAFPETSATLFLGSDPEGFLKHGPLIHYPLLHLVSLPLDERAAKLSELLPTVSGLIFPSRFAVRSFMEAVLRDGDARSLTGKQILAVGPATADELLHYGIRADGAADDLGGVQSLGKKLANFTGRFLYPCSDRSPQNQRIASLAAHGIELVPVNFYRNEPLPTRPLPRVPFTRVLFTSSSTVERYFRDHPAELRAPRTWLAVGPSTLRALEALGLEADVIEG